MELIIILTALCIAFSAMLTPSASHLLQVQSPHHLADHDHKVTLHTLVLSRKLKLNEAAPEMGKGDKELVSRKKQKEDLSGKVEQKGGEKGHATASRGTRQEWVEGSDVISTSQFFTMDYSHVRRRRPIHNKALPVAP